LESPDSLSALSPPLLLLHGLDVVRVHVAAGPLAPGPGADSMDQFTHVTFNANHFRINSLVICRFNKSFYAVIYGQNFLHFYFRIN
jgi:hypothetical protein